MNITYDEESLKDYIKLNSSFVKNLFSSNEIKNAISHKQFDILYSHIDQIACTLITCVFLISKVKFLEYMRIIPIYCFKDLDIFSIIIPEGVDEIHNFAFLGCEKLKQITIPKSLDYIGARVFMDCEINKINYQGTKEEWDKIEKNENWNSRSAIQTICCTDGDIKLK